PELAAIFELPPLPPLPPLPVEGFDYDEYEKDGDSYLEEWSDGFKKEFSEKYQKKVEAWQKKKEKSIEKWEERNAAKLEAREARVKSKTMIKMNNDRDNRLGASADSANKGKVQKRITITMPKSLQLQMNVKHGAVIMAAAIKNLKANLRHTSFSANTIEGTETDIVAAYAPIVIKKWNFGKLRTDYIDKVAINEVGALRLKTVSSNVTIEKLNDRAMVDHNLGVLKINQIAPSFTDLDISVTNGEVACKVPTQGVALYINGSQSSVDYPQNWDMTRIENNEHVIHKGSLGSRGSQKSITIHSEFSEVTIVD
ncbi:MAG: hypothetical protein AAGF77_11310, partial [Bacteroidota bacterium]